MKMLCKECYEADGNRLCDPGFCDCECHKKIKKYQVHTEWLNSEELAKEIQKKFQETIGLEVFISEKRVVEG